MHRLITRHVKEHTEKTAIVFGDQSFSYHWLEKQSMVLAAFLQAEKVKKFAFCMANSPVNVLAYLATSIAGCDVLAINPRLTHFELSEILNEFQPDLFIIESDRLATDINTVGKDNNIRIVTVDKRNPLEGDLWSDMAKYQDHGKQFSADSTKTHIYHLTSGAQGHSKYCEHTVEQITRYALNRAEDMGFTQDDELLVNLSLNHAFAFSYQLLPALAMGLPLHIIPAFDSGRVFDEIVKGKVTSLAMLPTMAYHLALYAQKQPPFQHCLRYCLVAGDALPTAFQKKFKDVFAKNLYQGVGMTEVFGYSQNTPNLHDMESSGRLFDSVTMQIRNDHGDVLGANKIGDVFIKNEATLNQYLFQPTLTQSELADGWVNSGDVGYVDAQRFFYFLGRKKQIIIRGGSNISPVEVESAIYRHAGVLQCAVVGKDCEVWGQTVWAYIVLDDNFDGHADEIYQHCKEYLAEYKVPERIHFVDALPQNATGKIDRYQLQALANETERLVGR